MDISSRTLFTKGLELVVGLSYPVPSLSSDDKLHDSTHIITDSFTCLLTHTPVYSLLGVYTAMKAQVFNSSANFTGELQQYNSIYQSVLAYLLACLSCSLARSLTHSLTAGCIGQSNC